MDHEDSAWRYATTILQIVTTAAAITGLVRDSSQGRFTWWLWSALIFLILVQIVVQLRTRPRKLHTLTEQTEKFNKFFADWYSRSGTHLLYCDDIEWLETPDHSGILDALIAKGRNVKVFVRDDGSPICQRLRDGGVRVCRIPTKTQTRSAISMHRYDGVATVLVRHKFRAKGRKNTIRFIETKNPHMVALAADLFRVINKD